MTVAGSAAALTKAINETTKALDITEASLDAKVTAVQTSEAAAGADKTEAEEYRDEAAAHAVSVAGDLTTVQGNVTYQGISAILAEKAVTAVDVFVYDTSLDSDGGAWRKRCQHTSWYNEPLNTATRGARREFPAVAVILAEINKITIYDGDDPAMPMWMVFTGTATDTPIYQFAFWTPTSTTHRASAVVACNGKLIFGVKSTSGHPKNGLCIAGFIDDILTRIYSDLSAGGTGLSVVDRNAIKDLPFRNSISVPSSVVYDVAMSVLPDAPVDPATGLHVPTIFVANSQVSVIKHDGTVYNKDLGSPDAVLQFSVAGTKVVTRGGTTTAYWGNMAWDFETDTLTLLGSYSAGLSLGQNNNSQSNQVLLVSENEYVGTHFGVSGQGLGLIDWSNTARTLSYARTSTWVSGWQTQNMRGAFLADTDDTDLVGRELVTNGTFDTDLTGWTNLVHATWASDAINCANGQFQQNGVFTGSKSVRISWKQTVNSGTRSRLRLRSAAGNFDVGPFYYYTGTGPQSIEITTSDGLSIWFYVEAADDVTFDNISVVELDADRSINAKPLTINGTITRSPVADGAELVGYSGFSAANYLEQPYNSALDFGIGDFCVMGWAKESAASDWLVDRMEGRDGSNSLHGFNLWQNTQSLRFDVYENNSATSVLATTVMGSSDPLWYFFAAVRRKGALEMYINGVLEAITNGPDRNTNYTGVGAPPPLIIGARAPDGGASWLNGHAALIRISATAPTPNQIAKIYEDERRLFMPGAQCTLYGTSDTVTALAHDPKTNLLHVGTSAGRSVFDGLQRVAHTETPVTTAISAAGGLIVEE